MFSRGQALRKVPQEPLVDTLFAEIDKYVGSRRVDVDAARTAEAPSGSYGSSSRTPGS